MSRAPGCAAGWMWGLLVVLALVTGEAAPRAVDLGWGALAGVGGVVGLAALPARAEGIDHGRTGGEDLAEAAHHHRIMARRNPRGAGPSQLRENPVSSSSCADMM